jgi:hypothetical protein
MYKPTGLSAMPHNELEGPAREIRVFLSSTFKDMGPERNHLMAQVFPLVRQRCHEREVVFTEIDLRWGITEEAAQNGRTVQICLEEIARCRTLQVQPFFIGFLGERYGWVPMPQDLARYWETHADSPYAKPIREALAKGMSVTELEIRFGFLDQLDSTAPGRVLMLLRDAALTQTLQAADAPAPSLRARMRQLLGGAPKSNEALLQLKGAVRAAHRAGCTGLLDGYASIEDFGRAVQDFLLQQLDRLFPQAPSDYVLTQATHRAYAASRLRFYAANPQLRQQVLDWLEAPGASQLAMLQGASGSGKSAFLADIAAQLEQRGGSWVFSHFCGIDGYATLEHWRDRLLGTLHAQGLVTDALPAQDAARWEALPLWLQMAQQAMGQPMVLVLDALNQITNATSALFQLQAIQWPQGVRLLCSCTPELEVVPLWHIVPMPGLDVQARGRLVKAYLGNYAKDVAEPVRQALVNAQACNNPLFLKLVLEESRLHASHESLAGRVNELLDQPDAGALFLACLDGLDRDFAAHAPQMATTAARLLAASRRGLTHHELAELLRAAPLARVPDAVLLPLLANLQPYGEMQQGRLQLMHAILTDTLQTRHPDVPAIRRKLMDYFSGGESWALTEFAYQQLRLELAESGQRMQDMWDGQYDAQEVQEMDAGSAFNHLFRKDAESNLRIVDNFHDLRVFLKIWEMDSNVAYNGLDCIGAGKPWQLTVFQEKLLEAWFASLEPLDTDTLQTLDLPRLGAWLNPPNLSKRQRHQQFF